MHEIQRCPNCGAYVMSNDDFCPRCDHRLTDPAPEKPDDTGLGAGLPDDSPSGAEALAEPTTAERSAAVDGVPASADDPVRAEPLPDAEDTPLEMVPIPAGLPTELDVPRVSEPTPEPRQAVDASASDSVDEPISSAATTAPGRSSSDEPVTDPGAADADLLVADDPMDMTHPVIHFQGSQPSYHIPPAPYSPPPPLPPVVASPYVTSGYAADPYASAPGAPAAAFIQQRVEAYRRGGYRLRSNHSDEAVLTCGKRLGVGGWMLAFISLVGLFWYLLLLVLSGFQSDAVYIVLETDGYIYEDGPGAAHTRHHRMRVGRRWAMFGMMLGIVCLVLGIALGIIAGMVLTQERYQAALREAYPAVTLFEEQFSATEAAPKDVELARDGAVAFSILAGIAVVGLWGGVTLFVIGTIHAGAYRVSVPPLPGWG